MLSDATHIIGDRSATHTLELYLDLICPFSMKQLKGVREALVPLLTSGKLDLKIVLRQVPQPWHASSTLVHEGALGVAAALAENIGRGDFNDPKVAKSFQSFFFELMDGQKAFYDEPCSQESPNQTRERLADMAEKYVPREAFLEKVRVGASNSGTPVTSDLKLAIKYGRQNGVHVTPTVALDGLVDPSISSSFTVEDWHKWIKEKIGVDLYTSLKQ